MVLQRTNFNIPARFSFQPYLAKWDFVTAETVEWMKEPKRHLERHLELRVRIGAGLYGGLDALYGKDFPPVTVLMDRASIPPDVLQPHENHRNTPDISGRSFTVLICQKPEFKDPLWTLQPGDTPKNAWIMSDEFLNLEEDPESGWEWSVRQFLNKWGIWEPGRGYTEDRPPARILPPSAAFSEQEYESPDFVLVTPHLLKEQQEKYRRAVLPSNARSWLRFHSLTSPPLSFDTADEFPFLRVRRSYCRAAIEATITIDHLAEIRRGICKRCHRVFEKEKKYRMDYCSRYCANAASVERFRERQRKAPKKGAKRHAKS